MPAPSSFSLDKWYIDAVCPGRRALIGYWARLSWRGLSVTWRSVVTYAPDTTPLRRQSLRGRCRPLVNHSGIEWDSPRLATRIDLEQCAVPAFEEQLHPDVTWRCESPVARVRATLGDTTLVGVGYAERLRMRTTPWTLPMRELRWGRWADAHATRSVVWIEWRGDRRQSWVYLDGRRIEAHVDDESVRADAFTLALSDRVSLEERRFGEVAGGIPRLTRLLPRTMRDMQEVKWLSRGVLQTPGGSSIDGTSIHEVVTMG